MGYFPFFEDLTGRNGLIVGGGRVALRKARKLLLFGPRLTAAAPEICEELRRLPGLTLLERPFAPEDLEGMTFVIAASDDRGVNARVSALCREKGIPVNVADSPEESSFLFPALVARGSLTVGISTGGASPSAAGYLREEIEGLIPAHMDEILEDLQARRVWVRSALKEEASRSRLLRELFVSALAAGRPLTDGEAEKLLEQIRKGE